ncbi:MAG: aminotransferase class IV [Deltaproteobacteria bacterium]|nr:aminotransferase class IV [Deltaproteobacteria bacterium]
MKEVTRQNVFSSLDREDRPWQKNYLVMYSSRWRGYTVDPALMTVPLDDHLVHRGDGVFDTFRCVHGRIYQLEQHLERLARSAEAISLPMPEEYDGVRDIIQELVVRGGEKDCVIRITLSRGPGSFSTNPFDCPASQMYVIVIRYKGVPASYVREGTCIMTSRIPTKRSYFARIKSCNYLPNVLMKMEALQGGCPYSVALDEEGFLAEGSTENMGLVSENGILKFPGFERTLAGTTVTRVFDLAESLVKAGRLAGVRFDRIPPEEAYRAREAMLLGTSINVLPVVRFDGRTIGDGRPGPVCCELSELLWKDMTEKREMLTELDWGETDA